MAGTLEAATCEQVTDRRAQVRTPLKQRKPIRAIAVAQDAAGGEGVD